MESERSVAVVFAGTQYGYQLVLAVQEIGLLQKFYTCFYFKSGSKLARLSGRIRFQFVRKVLEQARGRSLPGIDETRVESRFLEDFFYIITTRLGLLNKFCRGAWRWRSHCLAKASARKINQSGCKAVVCFESHGFHVFRNITRPDMKRVLVYAHAHDQANKRVLAEEAKLNPEFAEGMPVTEPEEVHVARLNETAMANHMVVASDFSKTTLTELGVPEDKITVIPFGCDTSFFSPPERKPEDAVFRILFVGGVGQRKGVKYLLEAFKKLNLPDAELLLIGAIAGMGGGFAPYKGLYTRIPRVSRAELARYYRRADVFVLPSVFEGFAIVIVEAMASGLPVITTPNTGGPDVIREGIDGFIVPIRDVDALAEKIRVLYANRELRKWMGQNAAQRAQEFTWERFRRRFGMLIKDLIENRPVRS